MGKDTVDVSRREFVIGSTALGAGFSLGLYLPIVARAGISSPDDPGGDKVPEVNAWVVIRPDDTSGLLQNWLAVLLPLALPEPSQNVTEEDTYPALTCLRHRSLPYLDAKRT